MIVPSFIALAGLSLLAGPANASSTLTAPVQQAQAISQHLQQQRSQAGPPKTVATPLARPAAPRVGSDLPTAIDTDSAPKLRRAMPAGSVAPAAR